MKSKYRSTEWIIIHLCSLGNVLLNEEEKTVIQICTTVEDTILRSSEFTYVPLLLTRSDNFFKRFQVTHNIFCEMFHQV